MPSFVTRSAFALLPVCPLSIFSTPKSVPISHALCASKRTAGIWPGFGSGSVAMQAMAFCTVSAVAKQGSVMCWPIASSRRSRYLLPLPGGAGAVPGLLASHSSGVLGSDCQKKDPLSVTITPRSSPVD
ncbi:lysM domain protein [Burkholderia pseudomallei]|nr:lysM domain protein [Burkholderia pseudomallei]